MVAAATLLDDAFGEAKEDVFEFHLMRGDAVEGDVGADQSFHQEKVMCARVGEGDLQF